MSTEELPKAKHQLPNHRVLTPLEKVDLRRAIGAYVNGLPQYPLIGKDFEINLAPNWGAHDKGRG